MKALWFEDGGNARSFIGRDRRRQHKKMSILEGQVRLRSLETKLESRSEDGLNMYKGGIANILVRESEIWSCWPRRKEENW